MIATYSCDEYRYFMWRQETWIVHF
jgi:hypothetical protein